MRLPCRRCHRQDRRRPSTGRGYCTSTLRAAGLSADNPFTASLRRGTLTSLTRERKAEGTRQKAEGKSQKQPADGHERFAARLVPCAFGPRLSAAREEPVDVVGHDRPR